MATAFVTHPSLIAHEVPRDHPECPQRLTAIVDQLHTEGIYDLLQHTEGRKATRTQVQRVHTSRLIDELRELAPCAGYVPVDNDTYMGVHTLDAAWNAAGAAVHATELVLGGGAENAFCALRPPGHHAERDRAMGFCFFNNIAVAAAHALDDCGVDRVAVLDFDVHHGNGTENVFAEDGRVLFCSTFQESLFPFSGADTGSEHTVNVAMPAGTGSPQFRAAVTERWLPALDSFAPQMIFISAGFDGHAEDPLAGFLLGDDDYRWVTEFIVRTAERHAAGRIVSCLEGGYALDALGRSVCAHIRALAAL